jgi:phosphoserine phosphatase
VDDPARRVIPEGLDATLVLLRHGESEFIVQGLFQGQAETPLSAVGRRQAELAAGRLAQPHRSPALPVPLRAPAEIVHSPLGRAAETAAAVGSALAASGTPVPVRADPGFAEIAQGDWEGRPHTEIAERWADVLAGWRREPVRHWAPGGESLAEVQARVRSAIGTALDPLAIGVPPGDPDRPQVAGYRGAAPPDHPWTIVVGHDGVFKVLLLTLFDLPLERFWMFTFALCGITVVEIRGGRPVLRAHNLTEHLAPLLDERAEEVAESRARSGAL